MNEYQRFRMSPPPSPGGHPGAYEEAWTQWLLELSFFRDFVYRNPPSKGGKGELADAVVLYDDAALMTQVAAYHSARPVEQWAEKTLRDKLKQVQHTERMLYQGHVAELENEIHGAIEFDARKYTERTGIIVLAHDGVPYLPEKVCPALNESSFPVHVFSLRDFQWLIQRLDTAGDLLFYLRERSELPRGIPRRVHDEPDTAGAVVELAPWSLRRIPGTNEETVSRSVALLRRQIDGEFIDSDDFRYGLAIDEMIARAHDVDESLPYVSDHGKENARHIAEFLSGLTRYRRIRFGKSLIDMCDKARDGNTHCLHHYKKSAETTIVFLVNSEGRAKRMKTLEMFCCAAQARHDSAVCLGVATNPLERGRAYDFLMREGRLSPEERRQYLNLQDLLGEERELLAGDS